MNDRKDDLTPEYDEYSLAAILREYTQKMKQTAAADDGARDTPVPGESPVAAQPAADAEAPAPAPETPGSDAAMAAQDAETAESIAERSRRIVMEALGDTLRQYQRESAQTPREDPAPPDVPPPEEDAAEPAESASVPPAPETPPAEEAPDDIPGWVNEARGGRTGAPAENEPGASVPRGADGPPFRERVLMPLVRLVATWLARRQMQNQEAANWPEPVDVRETPELSPRKAGKFYTSLLGPLKLRFRISLVLCLILAWIGLGLPMAGMLRTSMELQAGVSVVLTLTIMIAALDVFSTGLRQLFDLCPGMEALAALAAILSCVDGTLAMLGVSGELPFCAIGGAALTAALWGEILTCRALRRTFKVAAASKFPSVLACDGGGENDSLLRDQRDTAEGIVRRSESRDLCQTAYAAAAPFLLVAALILSILASLRGQGAYFLHTFSALVSVSASFAAFFSFPLPWAIATRKLKNSGVALAGYAGCADIGKIRRIVVTDEDLFPPGTAKFSEINIQEGMFLGKVVSSTAALIDASGSGVAPLFRELVDRRGYHIPPVEEFAVHEGGGLSGIVGGERILVGSAGFMNLMGIRLPQNLQAKNSICAAISGELVGVFVIDYIPVTSVQDALVTLMRGRTQTVFAIRDFNITPRMISQLFRLPTDKFNFPSFRERYRMTGERADIDTPVDAVLTRSGMLPLVEAAEAGRKAYSTCRVGTILSLIGTVIGMIIMFILFRAGAFDTATAGNVLSFMLLWSLPVVILSVGQNRT